MQPITIFWHRRDLRIHDNTGLYHALQNENPVLPLFIFDTQILDKLEDKKDKRLQFIHDHLTHLQKQLSEHNSSLLIKHGNPIDIWKDLLKNHNIQAVYTNRDYEPYAQARDKEVYQLLKEHDIPFKGYKDHVIFDKNEVLKKDGKPYTVFTPYSKVWKANLQDSHLTTHPTEKHFDNFFQTKPFPIPTLKDLGFQPIPTNFPASTPTDTIIEQYAEQRNFPSFQSTSRLGVHLRFGTISIRELAKNTKEKSEVFLNELIWRDFYHMIIYHFPHTVTSAFKPKYNSIPWRNNETEFKAWCDGKTGYPIVDAGMRELNETGFMHNRVRMITASFLTKHLLINWQWGEAYFAQKLLDFDLAANNGGWQWAASSGCDAAPYFRIFNPTTQLQKFDKQLAYVKQWIPEWGTDAYPKPIVDHKFARQRAIDTYKETLNAQKST